MGPGRDPFAAALRRLRARSGLTQEQLAERAGLSANAISALERGERRHPYPYTVRALEAALGLDAEECRALEATVRPRSRVDLPAPPDPLIGREGDVRAVADLLIPDTVRLVTLTGPGGVGKTRLAMAAAAEVSERFTDGLAFVSLAPLKDPALVVPTTAHVLGLHESGAGRLGDVLRDHLRSRKILLMLDNFEHLLAAAPEIAALVAAAPRLTVLTTSRSPLRVRAEQLYEVLPLSARSAADLYRERAARVAPSTDMAPVVVAEICRRLDHLPLAVELAAVRTRLLSPPALLAQLDRPLAILTTAPRDLPARQRTLSDTIAWSYELLGAAEQRLFRCVGVFAGGWALDAASPVGELDEPTTLQLHEALLDASLIVRGTDVAGPRYELLETIRAYALERLTSAGEFDAACGRHADHYGGLARTAERELWGPAQPEWLDRLELEHHNLRLAQAHLLDKGEADVAADVSFALWPFWWIRGYHGEARRWVEETLCGLVSISAAARAKLLYTAASMMLPLERYEEAGAKLDEAAALARHAGDDCALAWVLTQRGFAAILQQRADLGLPVLAEAEAIGRQRGDVAVATMAAAGMANAMVALGRLTEAERLLAAVERRARELKAPWLTAVVLNNRGRAALVRGDHHAAEAPLRESAATLGQLGDTWAIRYALTYLADAASLGGEFHRAALLYGAAYVLMQKNSSTFPANQRLSERCRAAAVTAIGAERFDEIHQQGRALPMDEVIALAAG